MPEFDKDGCFWPASARISLGDAMRARNIGKLQEPYLGDVLAQFRRRILNTVAQKNEVTVLAAAIVLAADAGLHERRQL